MKMLVWLFFAVLALFSLSSFPHEHTEYRPGRGFRIHSLKMTVGGYSTFFYKSRRDYEEYKLEEISLLLYGDPLSRVRYFLELELHDVYRKVNGEDRTTRLVDIERLYVDYEFSEALKLRVGRFITPLGIWNPIHIDVLKWTVSDPAVVAFFFPNFVTGVQLFGNLTLETDYALFFQNNRGISERYNNLLSRRSAGGEIRREIGDNLKVAVNGGWFDLEGHGEISFAGANALFTAPGTEISGEMMYALERRDTGEEGRRFSYYLQGVRRILPRNYAVLRYCYYRETAEDRRNRALTIGWNFRPYYFLSLKAEYQFRERGRLNTFFASVSGMF